MAQVRFVHLQQLEYRDGRSSSCFFLACLMTLMIETPGMDGWRKGLGEAGWRFVVSVNSRVQESMNKNGGRWPGNFEMKRRKKAGVITAWETE